ncbi:MAG TPA: carboxypeptidase regulatory-like domain-containing protein [Bryobacteraceae bacterium]|nr:carboxypeptidase regulatory-like domain-containing protein [Bryobacteraceae bacterium]
MSIARLMLITVAACTFCMAQIAASTVRGTAADSTDAVVVDAEIAIVNLDTNTKRTTRTTGNGDFEFPDLLGGRYRLTATAGGFKTFVAENIILETGQIRRINVTFEVGAVNSEVTVSAAAAVIATDTGKIQGQFTNQRFDEAPLIGDGRNPGVILTTLPNVQSAGSIYTVQMAGQSNAQIQQGIDGHTSDGAVNQISNIHVVQEVVAVPTNNSAEFSRVGYFNMTIKSGSNNYHGRLAYYHRNSALRARNFFETQKPQAKTHDIIAQLSGRIIRDKTFFFVGYNTQRWPGASAYLRDVPTTQMRGGDFSQLLAANRIVRDPLNGSPFPNNVIPTSRINPLSLRVQDKYIPTPNQGAAGDLARNFQYIWPYPSDLWYQNSMTFRIDHQVSQNNRLYGKFQNSLPPFGSFYVLSAQFPVFGWTRARNAAHMVIEDTHIVSPSVVNTIRFGLYASKYKDGDAVGGYEPEKADVAIKELGLQGVNPNGLSAMGFPRMDITGYPSLYNTLGGTGADLKDWGVAESLTWSVGRHVLKFGGEYKWFTQFNSIVPQNNFGTFNFNGSLSGYGYSDFLLGLPYSSARLTPLMDRTQTDNEFGLYIQDSFKATRRLTLDLGLRWERFGSPTYKDGLIYNWDRATGNVIVPESAIKAVSPLYPSTIKIATGDVRQKPSLTNFAPRIGGAYRLIGDTTVLRGGYGIFTETLGLFARAQGSGPYELGETFFNSVANGQPLFAFPNPFPVGAGTIASQSVSGYPLETSNGHIHQFNVTLEQQLRDTGFRLTYLGSRNVGVNYSVGINKPEASLTPFNQSRRPFPQFVGASEVRNDGAQTYNAFTFEVQRKVGQLTFDNHWTWASNYSKLLNLQDPYAPLSWSRVQYTTRHRVVFNTIWRLPVGHGRKFLSSAPKIVDHVLGGWQMYWIAFMESGPFFSPSFSGSDPSNTNTSGGLPDRIKNGNLPAGERTIDRWFDASAFAVPAAGRYGNSGAFVLEGPGMHTHNVTVTKEFTIREGLKLAYMASIQNLFNRPNFGLPSSNISAPGSVGKVSTINSVAPARDMIMRLRLDF